MSSLDIVFLIAGGAVVSGVIISPLVRIAESDSGRQDSDEVSVPQVIAVINMPVDYTLPNGSG